MNIVHQCKQYGVKEIILSYVAAIGRVNADVLIHFSESFKNFWRKYGFCIVNNGNILEEFVQRLYLYMYLYKLCIYTKVIFNQSW